jgi:hypothetical protein
MENDSLKLKNVDIAKLYHFTLSFFLYPVSLLRGTKRMRSPEETSSGCGGVNTPTQEPDLF